MAEAKAFVAQHGFAFSIRSGDTFHDRAVIVDRKQVFVLGAVVRQNKDLLQNQAVELSVQFDLSCVFGKGA